MKQQGVSGKLRDVGPEVEWKDANLTQTDLRACLNSDEWEYTLSEEFPKPHNWTGEEHKRRYKEYSEWSPTNFAIEHLDKNKSKIPTEELDLIARIAIREINRRVIRGCAFTREYYFEQETFPCLSDGTTKSLETIKKRVKSVWLGMLYGKLSSKVRKRREELRQLMHKIHLGDEHGYSVETLSREVFPKTPIDLVEAILYCNKESFHTFGGDWNGMNNCEIAQRLLVESADFSYCKNLCEAIRSTALKNFKYAKRVQLKELKQKQPRKVEVELYESWKEKMDSLNDEIRSGEPRAVDWTVASKKVVEEAARNNENIDGRMLHSNVVWYD